MVITGEGVVRGQCDDCIGQRVCGVVRVRRCAGQEPVTQVTVLEGCAACEGDSTVIG